MSNTAMGKLVGVSIGQAAALYQVAPSTLRWWEKTGLLPEPPRVNGRRVYDEVALRRIGLAYLCCVTGAMPLAEAAPVTSGQHGRSWRQEVGRHVARLDADLRRLRDARAYLLHLLQCPDEDVAAECSHLEGELADRTPAGDATAPDLLSAAAARSTRGGRPVRDGKAGPRDETATGQPACRMCGCTLAAPVRGRRRLYCSAACRQRQYRRQRASRERG